MKYFLLFILLTVNCFAEVIPKTCNISENKKEIIKKIYCEYTSPEYREYGDGCAKRSTEKKLLDTAIHLNLYRVCGYDDFADKLKKSGIKVLRHLS